jgi:transcriptional regulator with XRE-family HTH domain
MRLPRVNNVVIGSRNQHGYSGDMGNRIKELREARGLSLEALGEAMGGVSRQQVWKLENGVVALTQRWMERLAGVLECTPAELLSASGTPIAAASGQGGFVQIEEIDIQAGAGPEGQITHELAHDHDGDLVEVLPSKGHWVMPRELFAQVAPAGVDGLKIVSVRGDSMMPRFRPGQRVMVDTADKLPSPPGVFLVWDGFSLVIKQVEVIPFSEPPRVRLTSANSIYSPYERTLDEAYIQGRVIGVWEWT